ncbi:DUF1033 family protein [Lederbergia lenta]|uniref:Uncharacterized protein conserved in bacteria n=1 Tax=Lederbergia lenta TaxID=1467 RepID=A0A2X4W3I7_LEDLE|nr:DUF1033 family protein [Lederbergia lenta]MCM3109435.1 DUF1033 family protein [Lederbergia lenta]MEC2324800.1 DUF1033 family protein [Lederbergia lenta]SQI57623.1 Uncharacterized protein conserved in bacteria [Lederbergia lenta]
MYDKWKVITTKGESEPWWFFKGWQEAIIESKDFKDQLSAIEYYLQQFSALQTKYQCVKVKKNTMAAFWNEGEYVFCTSCDDDLQLYYGLLLMKNDEPFSDLTLAQLEKRDGNE